MIKKEEGQASVEYAIIYALAITAMILGVIVAWQMEAFKPSTPQKGSIGFSGVDVMDSSVVLESERMFLSLKNDIGSGIQIQEGVANIFEIRCYDSTDIKISPGESVIYSMKCDSLSGYQRNAYYRANVSIRYRNLDSERDHSSLGKVWGAME